MVRKFIRILLQIKRKISVSDLRPGDYQFIETKAPEHYVLDETTIPFTIERSQTKEIDVTGKNALKKVALN